MTTATEEKVHSLCDKLERRIKMLTWIAGFVITAFLTSMVLNTVSYGSTKNQVDINTKVLNFVAKDYIPAWFLEGIYQNMAFQTEEIVATIKGDKEKIKEINLKYSAFQKTMLNNFIQNRGGVPNVTRGIPDIHKGSAK